MQTIEFLKHVLPSEGKYCIVGKDQQNNLTHKFMDSIDDTADLIVKLNTHKNDVYFGCSTYVDGTSRTHDNVKEEKALWLDIDCGYDKKKNRWKEYQTKDLAIIALRGFCDVTKLPKPTIVDSGRGIHVYWTFLEPIDKAIWKPVAEGLKFLCVKHGLKSDPACTADISRILRVPGTSNYKDISEPHDVVVITVGEHHSFNDLANLIPVHVTTDVKAKTRRPMDEATKAVMDNKSAKFFKILDRCRKGTGCAQLTHIMAKQAEIDEPLWRSGLSIAAFCEDSETAIHAISKYHPDYNYELTETKANLIPGPHSCSQFESNRPTGCDKCPHKGKITTPIQLGRIILRAQGTDNIIEAQSDNLGERTTFQIPDYPHPYFRGKNGGVYKVLPDDAEEGFKVYDYDLYVVERLIDPDPSVGECVWLKLHLPHDGVKEFIVTAAAISTRDKAREVLVSKGVLATGKELDNITQYIMDSARYIQNNKGGEPVHSNFGWNEAKNKVVIGNREVSAFGVKYVPVAEKIKDLTPFLQKMGSFEEWKSAINVYARPGMEIRAFGFFCGFGSLLMPFLKKNSAVVNLYNPESGQGKTAILQAMTSIYGDPAEDSKLMLVKGDTMNSIINRLGYMGNLPQAIDEFTNPTPEEIHELLKFITTGRGKNRMLSGANGERQNTTIFDLIAVLSSNTDFTTVMFQEKAIASGEIMRFMQFLVEEDKSMTKSEADDSFGKLLTNYGHAGEIYAQYLVQNVDSVTQLLKQNQKKIDEELGLVGKERFFSATLAAVFTGAFIAKKLNLHDIPIGPVYQKVASQMVVSRTDVEDRGFDVMSSLADYINSNIRDILVINGAADGRSGIQQAPIVKPMNNIKARIEPDGEMLFIPSSEFRTYCEKIKVPTADFLKGLKKEKILVYASESKNLTKGMDIKSPPARCLWINIAGIEELSMTNLEFDIPKDIG
jgi:hypothetical protein